MHARERGFLQRWVLRSTAFRRERKSIEIESAMTLK
jgi:hypothetical protein